LNQNNGNVCLALSPIDAGMTSKPAAKAAFAFAVRGSLPNTVTIMLENGQAVGFHFPPERTIHYCFELLACFSSALRQNDSEEELWFIFLEK